MKTEHFKKLAFVMAYLVAIILCVRELREPDMWWQLRTGEWMLENGAITYTDMFSFTHEGEPWINVKWMYEVIIAFFGNFLGPEVVMLFQMLSIVLILFFLQKLTRLMNNEESVLPGLIGASLILLFIHGERLNGRPEMTTYTLSAVYIYLFQLFRLNRSKVIFMLIPLQLFWTNMHEAYGVGVVLLAIFLVGSWMEYVLSTKGWLDKEIEMPKLLSVVALLSMGMIVINPNGVTMLSHYLEIYSQLKENTFTTENFSFTTAQYWTYSSISNLILFLICTAYVLISHKGDLMNKIKSSINQYGLVYILIYFAFFYLSLQATRNSYFFACVAFPICAEMINKYFVKNGMDEKKKFMLLSVLGLIFYVSVGSGFFYKSLIEREKYGLRISTAKNVVGPSDFLKEHNIQGKGFVDYFSSSFMLWYNQPEFKTYLDLRDLDIYSQKFMSNVFNAYINPDAPLQSGQTLFNYMDDVDTFNYVVVLNGPQFTRFHKYMVNQDQRFELVYADGLASLYLRKSPENKALIEHYGFSKGKEVFHEFPKSEGSHWGNAISYIMWPFYSPYEMSPKEFKSVKRTYSRMIR